MSINTIPITTRRRWGAKLEKLSQAVTDAQDALLIGIAEAREAGLGNEDIAYPVRNGGQLMSSSGIASKAAKGEELRASRNGKKSEPAEK